VGDEFPIGDGVGNDLLTGDGVGELPIGDGVGNDLPIGDGVGNV